MMSHKLHCTKSWGVGGGDKGVGVVCYAAGHNERESGITGERRNRVSRTNHNVWAARLRS